MKMIDTHTHIYSREFDEDYLLMVERAKEAGIEKVLLPNIDKDSIESLHTFADKFPDFCYAMMGLHPTSVDKNWKEELAVIKAMFSRRKYIAVGEIGLDLYWSQEFVIEQKAVLQEQLRWAIEYDLPVSLHSRNAVREVVKCIKSVGKDKLRGVFHSFGGDGYDLQEVLALENFMVGVNGTVTFKNSTLPALLKEVDLSRLVVETDAPYLSPMPYRGKRNEPSYIPFIIAKLAEIYGVSSDEVARVTTANAERMFSIAD